MKGCASYLRVDYANVFYLSLAGVQRYPNDPELMFEKLPAPTFKYVLLGHPERESEYNAVVAMEQSLNAIGSSIVVMDMTTSIIEKTKLDCDLFGRNSALDFGMHNTSKWIVGYLQSCQQHPGVEVAKLIKRAADITKEFLIHVIFQVSGLILVLDLYMTYQLTTITRPPNLAL